MDEDTTMPDRSSGRPEAVVSHRAVSGLGLVVFPEPGVRATIPAGGSLGSMSDEELVELAASAAPLTATEAILDHEDGPWLVQATGPAWAESAASDVCGLLFTRLDGSGQRWAIEGREPGPLPPPEELRSLLDRARDPDA